MASIGFAGSETDHVNRLYLSYQAPTVVQAVVALILVFEGLQPGLYDYRVLG